MANIKEIWKDIPNYERYQVSNFGNVFSKWSNKILKPTLCKSTGYLMVDLKLKGKKRKNSTVHRLVAICFCDGMTEKSITNHINGIKTDNRAVNLEWSNYKDNFNHSQKLHGKIGNSKIHKDQVPEIIELASTGFYQKKTIANKYGVTVDTINNIIDGITWGWVTEEKSTHKFLPDIKRG